MWAIAYIIPLSIRESLEAEKLGGIEIPYDPYPYNKVGAFLGVFFLFIIDIGIFLPSNDDA